MWGFFCIVKINNNNITFEIIILYIGWFTKNNKNSKPFLYIEHELYVFLITGMHICSYFKTSTGRSWSCCNVKIHLLFIKTLIPSYKCKFLMHSNCSTKQISVYWHYKTFNRFWFRLLTRVQWNINIYSLKMQ